MASISTFELKSCYPTLLPTHCRSNASSGSLDLGARNSVRIALVSARQCGFQRFEFKGQRVREFSSWTSGKDGDGLLLRGRTNGRRPWAVRIVSGKLDTPKPTFVPLEQITGEEHFDQVLREAQERNQPIIVDWLAAWCRKCIYLKPKLEKLSAEYYPDIKFFYVDVNNVPQSLVKRAEVTKMPTIQFWRNGERTAEVIGGHQVWLVLDEIREMIKSMR